MFATPFVQGRLRGESLVVKVATGCAHCSRPMHIQIDSELSYSVEEAGADPMIFVPTVDLYALDEPTIIDAF